MKQNGKRLSAVIASLLLSVAGASADVWWGVGGDWNTAANWYSTTTYGNGVPAPTDDALITGIAADGLQVNQVVNGPTTINVLNLFGYGAYTGYPGGQVTVNADFTATALYYGVYFPGAANTTEGLLLVNSGAVSIGTVGDYLPAAAPLGRFQIDAGSLNITSLGLSSDHAMQFDVNNGLLEISDDAYGSYYGPDVLTVNLTGGALRMDTTLFADTLVPSGCILVNGTTVTAANMSSLLSSEFIGGNITEYTIAVPEPSALALLGLSLGCFALLRRKR